jgi:hypothetical protein
VGGGSSLPGVRDFSSVVVGFVEGFSRGGGAGWARAWSQGKFCSLARNRIVHYSGQLHDVVLSPNNSKHYWSLNFILFHPDVSSPNGLVLRDLQIVIEFFGLQKRMKKQRIEDLIRKELSILFSFCRLIGHIFLVSYKASDLPGRPWSWCPRSRLAQTFEIQKLGTGAPSRNKKRCDQE